jgi:hypothetical protein
MKIDIAPATIFLQTLKYDFTKMTTGTVFEDYLRLLLGLNTDLL